MSSKQTPTQVLIAGGGVAAVEAAVALKDMAGDLVHTTMVAPQPDFTYRPELVGEPFSHPAARRYPLAAIANDLGVELKATALKWVDIKEQIAHTDAGEAITYDALLLGLGATATPILTHALTLVPERLDEQMQGVIQDLEAGWIKSLAFVIPERGSWPLPMYELALMAARRADDMNTKPAITLITPENEPLAIFGPQASQTLQQLLDQYEITTITSSHCTTPAPGRLTMHPMAREIRTDLVITLPELSGAAIPGIPVSAAHGFLTTDRNGHVAKTDRVFAAGDITDFPVKQGGIAAQQADSAAASIARLAGADIDPQPIVPVLCGLLWDGKTPLYLRARMTGTHGSRSQVSSEPLWDPPGKIQARYLGAYLATIHLEPANAAI